MLIESDPHQTRIAVLEDDRLIEIFVERPHQRGSVGNVYKGRVSRVLPGMQAAFVDIGLERIVRISERRQLEGAGCGCSLREGSRPAQQAACGRNAGGTRDQFQALASVHEDSSAGIAIRSREHN